MKRLNRRTSFLCLAEALGSRGSSLLGVEVSAYLPILYGCCENYFAEWRSVSFKSGLYK